MNFDLDDTQREFVALAAEFFSENSGVAAARTRLDADTPPVPGATALAELGLLGLMVPEENGGLGQGVLDAVVVAEQAGRVLASPSLTTAARATVLLAGHPDLLEQLATGQTRFAVLDGSPDGSDPSIDAASAELFLARDSDGRLLCGRGTQQPCDPIDASRSIGRVCLVGPRVLIENADPLWDRARDIACIVMAAEDLGTATQALERALEYAKTRQAFDRFVGSFAPIKHRLVNVWADLDQVRSLVWWAAWSADSDPAHLAVAASSAKAYSARVVEEATELLVHVHGGMGFTWEHDAHLFWRRAKTDIHLLGERGWHVDRVARLGLAAGA